SQQLAQRRRVHRGSALLHRAVAPESHPQQHSVSKALPYVVTVGYGLITLPTRPIGPAMTDYGIDLSNWNRVDDWGAVRANNISFASIKVSESTDFVDPAAGNHTEGARSVGIYPGGYHFARNADLDTQVDVFAGQLHDHGLLGADSFPPMLDMESDDLRGNANEFVAAFTGKLRAITGVAQLAVYANLDW